MNYLLTQQQVKTADKLFSERAGLSERALVDKAAGAIMSTLNGILTEKRIRKIVVLCGSGMNGADGFSLSLLLSLNGYDVKAYAVNPDLFVSVTQGAYENCRAKGIITKYLPDSGFDAVIDAVFGVGFHGQLDKAARETLAAFQKTSALKISLDLPSGVNADTAAVADGAFSADITVAVCSKKPCHLLYPAKAYCGRVVTADMKFGAEVINAVSPYVFELNAGDYKHMLKKRSVASHKGDFGRAGLVVGSQRYRGAAVLATSAALRCGAGIVSAFVPDCIVGAFDSNCISAVLEPLKSQDGFVDDRAISSRLAGCTALLCGSGLGVSDSTARAVYTVSKTDIPAVFDGDALTIISHDLSLLERNADTVITPHVGEFSKLCGVAAGEIKKDVLPLALRFAREQNCVLLLKDSVSVIALPDGRAFILSNPTSALAKGGSGDVLAGMVCSFMAQGYSAASAALISATLHNSCGVAAEARFGGFSALPEDVVGCIPELLKL